MVVLEIVRDSLRRIGIIGETRDPSAEQGSAAVTRLNDLMHQWAERGIDLGWNTKDTTSDNVVLPLGYINGIKAQLAEQLAADYGVDAPAKVLADAEELSVMLNRQILQMEFGRPNVRSMPLGETCGGRFDYTTGTVR